MKGLAPGSDVDSALNNLADKMAAVEDPATRAKMATDAFGRSGVKLIPILAQGSEGIRKMSEEWGKLDEAQIDLMEHTNLQLEKAGSKSKVLLAQFIEGFKATGEKLKDMPWWKKIIAGPLAIPEAIREATKDTTPNQPDIVTSKAAQTPKEIAKSKVEAGIAAAKKISEEEDYLFAKPQEKVLKLTRDILAIRRQIEDSNNAEEQVKLGEKMVELEGKRKSIQDEIATNEKQTSAKKLQSAKDILEAQKKIAEITAEIYTRSANAQYASLQEVANSGYRVFRHNQLEFQQGPNAQEAQDIIDSENRARNERIYGNIRDAKADESYAAKLRQDLSDREIISPDEGMRGLNDKLK
ncbi:MAG TPA: hypothetical protein VN516_01595, partial [Candidatus Baltobacteraceae bacterium]|nr:hypothetical protein [Candidatus Baltobacteraceae bacterium]